jgi:hypothetical protein
MPFTTQIEGKWNISLLFNGVYKLRNKKKGEKELLFSSSRVGVRPDYNDYDDYYYGCNYNSD